MRDLSVPQPIPHGVDVHVGFHVRLRRSELRMSQQILADKLGLTFQQVQKYERGSNRISASKLFQIARALDVPVGWFFEGLGLGVEQNRSASGPATNELLSTSEGIAIANLFAKIKRPRVRRRILDLIRSIVDVTADDAEAISSGGEPDDDMDSIEH